ncbi:hydroxyacid dehydrogenase [Haloplanus aerogenes]|uniref:D-3-phosphoglycerate dehydrogenase n=1 Tax=Haloplanus aerogenes TaxID=660522 RepID=A0A3M0DUY1_9EURY|nr:hydroxyacid dehydrogenase [Haloplanus aerogenes]AZH25340.1 hydroxyacid dehydrogenase [Haloplanus aerogenes]RMB25037.1 D-3-phosphoglycerate dehydrogenase [Haloplanus aerogenes]
MKALVDQDLQPFWAVDEAVDDRLDLTVGVESDEAAVIDALDGKEVLLTTSRLPITGDVLASATDLEVVGKIGTGIDNVDLDAATDLGVGVTYTPGLNAAAVAEYTLGLAIAVSRDVVRNDHLLEAGGWRDETALSTTVNGKTVGIVGFGDIGSRVAAFFSGLNMDILAYDPYVFEEDTDVTGAKLTTLDDLLARSDIVTVNAELTEETRGMIDADAFARMQESAILINTARGPIVSESALRDALEAGEIAGAGLDVFETEPLPADSPLHDFDNVVATPHVAATTTETRVDSIRTLVDNVFGMLGGSGAPERYTAVSADR